MKKQIILLSFLALATLASCSKNADDPTVVDPGKQTQAKIILEIGQYGDTKSVGTPYAAAKVTVAPTFRVQSYFNGNILGTSNIEFLPIGETGNLGSTATVSTSATDIKLTGNFDGSIVDGVTLSSDVNTRQGGSDKAVVLVSGNGNIIGTETKIAEVSVVPEMARIEITPDYPALDPALTTLRNIKIAAIFINNTKITRGGNVDRTASADFSTVYNTTGMKSKLYDFIASGTRANSVASPVPAFTRSSPPVIPPIVLGWNVVDVNGVSVADPFGSKAVGYNIFPQSGGTTTEIAKATHPHIIVLVSYDKLVGDLWLNTSGYLNITAFKTAPSTYVNEFIAGSVYQFSLGSIVELIVDPTTTITTNPDPETNDVSITCTVSKWNIVPVTPEV